ncbi:MAG: cytochrome P450 [Spongiibacteraceae bacterium]
MDQQSSPSHVPVDRVVDFDMYAPPGVAEDFFEAWGTLQQPGVPDIVWTPRNGGHWIATRAEVIKEVLSDFSRFSSRNILLPKSTSDEHDLIPTTIDPPQHHFYRKTLNSTFAPAAVNRMDDRIREIVTDLIDQFEDKGQCNFTEEFAEILPIRIFLSMMDLPEEDTPQTKYWADQLLRPDGSITFAEALNNLKQYITPYVDERSGKDGTDLLSRLVNSEIDGREITRDEAIKLAVQVFIAGIDTVVNLLGFVFLFLAKNPAHRNQLVEGTVPLSESIEEILRRFPVVCIGREVREDINFHGVTLKAGEMIATPTPLAGIDDRFNSEPKTVDFARKTKNSLTFGTGAHICPGKTLARAELRITLEEWMKRIPDFSVDPDSTVTCTGGIVGVVDNLSLVWNR